MSPLVFILIDVATSLYHAETFMYGTITLDDSGHEGDSPADEWDLHFSLFGTIFLIYQGVSVLKHE